MNSCRDIGCVLAALLFAGCGLPPNYQPKDGERFWTLIDSEHWTADASLSWSPFRDVQSSSGTAVLTWRLGRDAAKPRAFPVGDNCMVHQGTWNDTEFTPPSHGDMTFDDGSGKSLKFVTVRTHCGFESGADDWKAGQQMSLKAAGDALPAFELQNEIPAEPTLTTWDLAKVKPDEIKLSRSKQVDLEWTGGSGEVLVAMTVYSFPAFDFIHGIWCWFPAEAGKGTVPLEAIQTLPKDFFSPHFYFAGLKRTAATTETVDVDWLAWFGRGAQFVWEK